MVTNILWVILPSMAEHFLHAVSTLAGVPGSWRSVRNVRRILIYKLDHLGDVLLATPAIRAVRRRFPDANIKVVVGEWSTSVLEHNPNIDEVLLFNSPSFARFPYEADNFREFRRSLGAWKPDLVIGLRDDWRTLWHPLIPYARRLNRGRVHLKEWLQRKREGLERSHEVDRLWAMLRPLGIDPDPEVKLDYFITPEEREVVDNVMLERGIGEGFAAIHAGTSVPLKEWSLDRFAEAARHIANRYGMQIVLFGSPDEVDRSSDLAAMIRDLDPVDMTGALSLRHSAALLERAALYLGSDGGAMHIASAVGTPTVGLFGPGAYYVFRPVGPHATAFTHNFPCSPCTMITCVRPHDTCMQAITAADVIGETDRLMDRLGQSAAASPLLSHRSPQ
jgi:ADP-heptose:LPS heptosyltransferase